MVERGQMRRWTKELSGYMQSVEPFIVLRAVKDMHPTVRVWEILEAGKIMRRYEDTITHNSEVIDEQGNAVACEGAEATG